MGNLMPPERISSLRMDQLGVGAGENFGFLPLFFGGFFLYIAYYGFDQSQVQREISSKTVNDSRRSLALNAVLRYPLVLSYCLLGLILGTYIIQYPSLMELLPDGKPDYLVPVFIVHRLPAGVVGFIVVAILAASMSSLDSSLNSLSAATVEDMIKLILKKPASRELLLRFPKISTIFWGIFCTSFAFFCGKYISDNY